MKKLLLGALLLLSILGFSQRQYYTRALVTQSSSNAYGGEILGNVSGKYELGGGLMNNDQTLKIYGITTQKITNEFSIGGKVGGAKKEKLQIGFGVYYGLTSYLQIFGKETGLIVSFGFDNTNNCNYGIGYQF